jgi:hypothetical protein
VKVRIIQLLCPSRHCVVATAYESPDGAEIPEMTEDLRKRFTAFVLAGANPWCGICKSKNLTPEDRATGFTTMAEALPFLQEEERKQAATREFFKASKG